MAIRITAGDKSIKFIMWYLGHKVVRSRLCNNITGLWFRFKLAVANVCAGSFSIYS